MAVEKVKAKISGARLMMHNGQLADPLNPYTKALKAVSKKKQKSDDDHLAVAKAEFQGSLYHDEDLGPVIPGEWIQSAMIQGAKAVKLGKQFTAGVIVEDELIKLEYSGPRTRDGLWNDPKFVDRRAVRVQMAKVMRTRPLFRDWSATFEISIFDGAVNVEDVEAALERAGAFVGIGDGRPRIAGKFCIEEFKKSK
ncbi:MAG: hypothetical protein ACLPJH_16925 [Myxococcaceae bacterium]